MKPVKYFHVGKLTSEIVIVNKSRLGVAYVESLIRCSSNNVTSKERKKELPPEIWHQIIELANPSPKRYNTYVLTLPSEAQRLNHDNAAITCEPMERRKHCYRLGDRQAVQDFERYMASPRQHVCHEDCPCHRPPQTTVSEPSQFESQAESQVDDSDDDDNRSIISSDNEGRETLCVPTVALLSTIPVLYHDLSVPDVISWIEHGRCTVCRGQQLICIGCNDGRRARENFLALTIPGDCGVTMLCPLCVGIEASEEDMKRFGALYGGPDQPDIEYYKMLTTARFKELGYSYNES